MKAIIDQIITQFPANKFSQFNNWILEEAIRIQQIPAPTFQEEKRAGYVAQFFEKYGLEKITIDDALNVYGFWKGGEPKAKSILIMAHTDTVFAEDTDLTIHRNDNKIAGPGLGDNSMAVAGMLGCIKFLRENAIVTDKNIWFVATSCEEGLGDLRGVKAAYKKLQHEIEGVINLEGLAFGHVYHGGIAVHRLHITAETDGGHSWLHFGNASAIHGIVELGAKITKLNPPEKPRTTFNIGMLEGGQTINSIASRAGLWLDMRSEKVETLEVMVKHVHQFIQEVETPELSFSVEVVGERPGGEVAINHPLVQGALHTLQKLGYKGTLETGSTDGNVPLAHGTPTITIGITRGGNAHRLDEYIDTDYIEAGFRQLVIMVLATTTMEAF